MCGIAGIVGERIDPRRVRAMTDAIAHRGPDGEGVLTLDGGRVVLGHRRLAILDLSDAGAQPMRYRERLSITYNGEIYNYVELRDELRAAGHDFRSDCDTEVLLAGYDEWGEGVLERLDGMFAFAIHDAAEGRLFLARDRFGEKPLFYAERDGELLFASEMKALFAAGVPARPNRRMLFHYLAYDAVLDANRPDATFAAGVGRLPPAHCLTLGPDRRPAVRRYWEIPPDVEDRGISFGDACERFRDLLETSIRRRLRSDVALGSSLSGGLDSSTIVLLAARLAEGAPSRKTFSARFDDPALDEGRWIAMVAERAVVTPCDTHPDGAIAAAVLDDVMAHQEEPFGSAAVIAQWEVMKLAAAEDTTVLLDGQGADETLGGYLHYFRPLFLELYRTNRERLATEVAAFRRDHGEAYPIELDRRFRWEATHPGALRLLGSIRRRLTRPDYLRDLSADFVRAHRTDPPPFRTPRSLDAALRHATTETGLVSLLRFADRSSMAFAREVRLPFLSHELVEFLFTLPSSMKVGGGETKRILRASMADVLPEELVRRKDKLGFRPPQAAWMAHPDMTERAEAAKRHLVDEGIVRRPRGDRDWAYLMASGFLRGLGV